MRLRMAGIALGATLLLLSGTGERGIAALVIVAYAIGAVLVRIASARRPGGPVRSVGIGLDILYASALVTCLPQSEPAWALYAFAIGTASQSFGVWGATAATASSIAVYDIAIGMRVQDISASALWPVQVLLAIGLLCVELMFGIARLVQEARDAVTLARAQRDLASARDAHDIADRLLGQLIATAGARGASVRPVAEPADAVRAQRGTTSGEPSLTCALGDMHLLEVWLMTTDEAALATARDLADHARPLFVAALISAARARTIERATRMASAVEALAGEQTAPGVIASLVLGARSFGTAATLIRRSDGRILGGEALRPTEIASFRETRPPVVLAFEGGSAGVVSAGRGLALVVTGQEPIDADQLRGLEILGATAGAMLAHLGERDASEAERDRLREATEELRGELRKRDESLASAVHELRTPLTSVTAYGQLISRNLQSALQQLAQLDRLISDLRGDARSGLALADVDAVQLARDAAQRQKLMTREAVIDVTVEGSGEFRLVADAGRIAQVLDNVLGNAVKFSPSPAQIEVTVRRVDDEVLLSVSDEGPGLAPEDADRIFGRYYRGRTTAGTTPGLGIGLAVSREIVEAHHGRIWAESAGAGHGTTFHIALPVRQPANEPTSPAGTR